MPTERKPTAEGLGGHRVTQFSIFLSNRVGALLDVVKVLNERNIHVLAISVQDSADTAIVRIVVSDPESVQQMFLEHGDSAFSTCDLVVVELKEGATELGRASSRRRCWPPSAIFSAATRSSPVRAAGLP